MKKIRQGESASKYIDGGFSLFRLNYKKPSPTISKTFPGSKVNVIHPIENRQITIEECKRICSFPDHFKLIGNYRQQWARLGNAVMPKFMQAIAETIKKETLC
jgi:DNA (cytosine-5)-methyltransferase 1